MRHSRRACFLNACAFLLLAVAPVSAQYRPKVSVNVPLGIPGGAASIEINGRTAVRLITSKGSLSPATRAQVAAGRLQNLIDAGADRKKLATGVTPSKEAAVVWGEKLILIVSKAEAKAHRSAPAYLAEQWAANIRWLLAVPPLTVSPASLTIPIGETRQLSIGGTGSGPVQVSDSRPEITTSKISRDGQTITVKGLAIGNCSVAVGRRDTVVMVDVAVRKYAGRSMTPQTVNVTGLPAPAQICRRMAESQASASIALEPGARAIVMSPTTTAKDLQPGEQQNLTFPVRVEGEGYLSAAGPVTVRVANLPLPTRPVGALLYSNSPERVAKYATLYVGQLRIDDPVRLLYHHQNVMGKPFAFNVVLANPSVEATRVQIIRGTPQPEVDTVAVGYRAGVEFMRNFADDIGEIVEVPPMSKVAVYSRIVDKIETASGIIQFRQLGGSPLVVRITADLAQDGVLSEYCARDATPGDGQLEMSPWVYPIPTKFIETEYIVGKTWAFIRIGRYALQDAAKTPGMDLYGNYGVLYNISLKLQNPTSESKQVNVVFEPGAGLASGVFMIDGKWVKVTHISPQVEVTLVSYTLAPNQSRLVSIKTVPLAGSAYPATILVRS